MKKKLIVMHSPMSPSVAAAALARSIDAETLSVFSLSYQGNRLVVGEVWGNTFRLQKRPFMRNDFALHFHGTLQPEPGGTRIEGYFGLREFIRIFMWIWLGMAITIGGSIFVSELTNVLRGRENISDDPTALIVPPLLIIFGLVLPRIGRLFSAGDKALLLDHLRTVLEATIEQPPLQPPSPIHP